MARSSLLPLALLPLLAAATTPPEAPITPPAPPAPQPPPLSVELAPGMAPQRVLLKWVPGETLCHGDAVRPVSLRAPLMGLARPVRDTAPRSVTVRFRIDGSGRPLSIAPSVPGYLVGGEDIAPSLAASRFPAGARDDCAIDYALRQVPMDEAPVADLIAYSVVGISGPLPREGFERITAAGHDCMADPRPAVLRRSFPDFRSLPGTPGAVDWSMVAFDLDGRGHPVRATTLSTTGNAALDAAALGAVRDSRFGGGARKACLYPYWRGPETLPAPDPATTAPRESDPATCPGETRWESLPPLVFPAAFQRRAIEGWAIIGYDVAPWGATGNVRVLAAEPAAEFGQQALRLVSQARRPTSPTGASGCVTRVRFVLPERPQAPPPRAEGF